MNSTVALLADVLIIIWFGLFSMVNNKCTIQNLQEQYHKGGILNVGAFISSTLLQFHKQNSIHPVFPAGK
jgi:hypothetical protein